MVYEYSSNTTSSNEVTPYVTRTNLYTDGGEYFLPNGKEYKGFYHIHPEKGAMVGATHTNEAHDILTLKNGKETPQISNIELVTNYSYEDYSEKDLKLISPVTTSISEFRPSIDRVEFIIYNEQGLLDNIEYDYKDYSILSGFNSSTGVVSSVDLDPGGDLIKEGYTQGFYQVVYNFLRDKVSSSPTSQYYISQISADRTELRLASNTLSNEEIETSTNSFISELEASPFFEDFFLNFGNNNLITGLRIALDDEDNPDQFSVVVKLYEALPAQFGLKDSLWLSLQTAEAVSFDVEFTPRVSKPSPPKFLKGPNFDIAGKDIVNNSTVFQNAESLITTVLTSSFNELQNVLNQKGAKVSIDYEDFNNFVYFSSAQSRLENFYYKAKEIEDYSASISIIDGISIQNSSTSASKALLEKKVTNIIANLDEYENFLYYNSGSDWTWPKTNTAPPYQLALTSSALLKNWYGSSTETNPTGVLGSASLYDIDNSDRLVNSLPSYVKNDSTNQPFFSFMDMVGQHFDVFWTYTKAVGDRYDADNRLNHGISKDIVADAIRSMGVTLYQNNFSSDDLSTAFLGVSNSGSLLPPTGSEAIDDYITASSDLIKFDDINKETYKRIFHNLPFLLKKKGTVTGLRTLINTYGIPDTILRISEFGGKDIDNTNDWDYYQSKFNYTAYHSGSSNSNFISTSFQLNSNWNSDDDVPNTIMFRFKPEEIDFTSYQTKSIVCHTDNGSNDIMLTLTYEGSGLSSGSYSGSIPSASNQFASLSMALNGFIFNPAVNAPFYDGNWWGVQLTRVSSSRTYTLRVANNIYGGGDGFKIGYTASKSNVVSSVRNNYYTGSNAFYLSRNVAGAINGYTGLTGSFQELRFYNKTLGEAEFHDFVMNPYSIEGTDYSSSANNLVFRAPLGSDLKIDTGGLTSTHPKITGSSITNSFASDSTYEIGNGIVFPTNIGFIYYDQPAVGIKNRITEKVRITDLITASGDTLTPYKTIQQRYINSESYTRDINYIEVAFSPQNEINDDINSTFGYFNIGEYIGDPSSSFDSATSYEKLNNLRDNYFEKYSNAYDWRDYIRLIKYFDNSLFKMLKDFVPSKTSISTGVVVKQHLLERNKQRPALVSGGKYNNYTSSIDILPSSSYISGGAAGVFNSSNYSGSGQTWDYDVSTKNGVITVTQNSQDEFYNGELSGSDFRAITAEVGPPKITGSVIPSGSFVPLLNNVDTSRTSSVYYTVEYNSSYILPSNLDLITSGSSFIFAEVSDSNYTRNSWVTSRYKGSRGTSRDFNTKFTK